MQRLITVTEGMPSIIVQEKLAAVRYLTGAAPLPAEGSVLPDSYGFKRGEARSAVVARMLLRHVTDAAKASAPLLRAAQKQNAGARKRPGVLHARREGVRDGGTENCCPQHLSAFSRHHRWNSCTLRSCSAEVVANLVSPVSGLTATKKNHCAKKTHCAARRFAAGAATRPVAVSA